MKEKRNGFTLIELLAVIVILAIIALIAVPVIMNIITKANKSAFKDSGYGIIKAGELYYTEKLLDVDGMTEDVTFTFPEADGLELKGSRPVSGNMIVTKEGKVAIAISNGKYCVRRGYDDSDITIDENIEDCKLDGNKDVATSYTNGIMTSEDKCIIEGTCANGTKICVNVNDTEKYCFYSIKDENNELTLIMDKNLGSRVAWISKTDYIAAGGTESDYEEYGNNNKGPITAINALEERTTGWTNIPAYNYTYTDGGGGNKYSAISKNNIRARLLTPTEAINLGCQLDQPDGSANYSCPAYLYINTSTNNTEETPFGYWLSAAHSSSSSSGLNVNYFGEVDYIVVTYDRLIGVRPVITISKTL